MACGGEQVPVACGLCEEETKIKWKCVDCDMLLCNKCKEKIHVKFAKDHEVISIQELRIHNAEMDFSNLSCRNHSTQSCVMFCKTCDCLVCPLCIYKTHNGHGLVPIREGYDINIDILKTCQKNISTNIEELKKRKAELKYVNKAEQFKYKNTTKNMELQRTELKKEVDKHIDKLKSEIIKRWRAIRQSIKKEENEVTLLIRSMKSKNSKVEEIIQSENAESVFVDGLESVNLIEETVISPCTMFDSIPTFLSGQISAINIGTLENVSAKDDMKSIKQFETEMSCVSLMTACSDDVLWISGPNKLQKAKIEGTSLKITDQKDIEIYGMALTQSKNLLLIEKELSVVRQISDKTGEITDSKYKVEDLELSAIHVNPDGKVTVGAYNGEICFPAEGRRFVKVMDKSGKHETTYEYDRQGKPLFTLITSITRTKNSNICVVDTLSQDWGGRLVILNEDGDVLNTFRGLSKVNTNEMSDSESKFDSDSDSSDSESDSDSDTEPDSDPSSFKPACVITTQSDNLILSNFDNGILFFLNSSGNVFSWYDTDKIGIDNPISFCMTSEHTYIGCFTNEGSSDNAKIYEVDIL